MRERRTLWQRIKAGARHVWAGEAVGPEDPGYLVHPADLYDGIKGLEYPLYAAYARWRRDRNGRQDRPQQQAMNAARVRELARMLELWNPYAQAIFTALRSYVLGEQGLTVEVTARRGGARTPGPAEVAVQSWLDSWMDADDWWSRERELYVRCHRDGEGMLRYFADRENVRLRFVEPEWVVSPDASPEWS